MTQEPLDDTLKQEQKRIAALIYRYGRKSELIYFPGRGWYTYEEFLRMVEA